MEPCIVSIIMPVYKTEEFIEKSILSVENQTYKNIELICINDGTPDNSFEICKELQKKYDNIILLENDQHIKDGKETRNHGLEYTRNHGLDCAKGKYVLFLDSDDILVPETIDSMVKVAEKSSSDIVMFTYSRIINDIDYPVLASGMKEKKYLMEEFCSHILNAISYSILSCVGTKLYKLDFINRNHLRFDNKFKYNEDAAFILGALHCEPSIYYINKPFYKYYIRQSGSIMSSYRPGQFQTIMEVRKLLKLLFQKHNTWEDKKLLYYNSVWGLMLASMENAVRFSGKKELYGIINDIRQNEEFKEVKSELSRQKNLSKFSKLLLFLTRKGVKSSIYLLLKIRKCLKG